MAHAVQEVKTLVPQRTAGNGVELGAAGSVGEAQQLQLDVTFQYQRIDVALTVGDGTEGDGSRDVGSTIDVLCATIEQEQTFGTQGSVGVGCRLVMDDGAMSLIGRNGVEGQTLIERLFGAQRGKLAVDAHLRLSAGSDSGFQPAQEAHEGYTVANHGLPESLLLGFGFDSLHSRDGGGVRNEI